MTIPHLRKAFDHIEAYTNSLLKREKDPKKRRRAFQAEWSKVFHRSLDDKAADAYLKFESKKGKKGSTRRQKGGADLAGAPLDYSTRPGIYGVYGQFPEYISGGFVFGNSINKMGIQEGCNSAAEAGKFQAPYTGFGAASLMGQKGGKRTRRNRKSLKGGAFPSLSEFASAASMRVLQPSPPPSTLYGAQMEFKGLPPYPSSMPNTATPPYQLLKPSVLAPTIGPITRQLPLEI